MAPASEGVFYGRFLLFYKVQMENVTLENGNPPASVAPGSKHQLREFVPLQLLHHGIMEFIEYPGLEGTHKNHQSHAGAGAVVSWPWDWFSPHIPQQRNLEAARRVQGTPHHSGLRLPSPSVAGFLPDTLNFMGLPFPVARLADGDTCAVCNGAAAFPVHDSVFVAPLQPLNIPAGHRGTC